MGNFLTELRELGTLKGLLVTPKKKADWKKAIEDAWSEQCRLVRIDGRAPCEEYTILVVVEWIAHDAPVNAAHYDVRVFASRSRAFMKQWRLMMDDLTAAHEFGHMLGNIDEYDGTCDQCPDRPVVSPSIMNDQFEWEWASPSHFWLIQRVAEEDLCSTFRAESVVERWHAEGGGLDLGQHWEDLLCNVEHEFS
jgi:hypothetical protein